MEDNKSRIYQLYFKEKLNIVRIAEIIGVKQPYITKILTTYYENEYIMERERRKTKDKEKIHDLYFIEKLNTLQIGEKLKLNNQYVSKVLNVCYKEEYEEEKARRRKEKSSKRETQKALNKKVKNNALQDVSYEDMVREHDMAVLELSDRGQMSNKAFVYANLNAYDVKGDKLIYNGKCGKKTEDVPPDYPLRVYVYN